MKLYVLILLVSFLFIPAVMFGVVSIWVFVFAAGLGFYLRSKISLLNQHVDGLKEKNYFQIRLKFWRILIEAALIFSLPVIFLFYAEVFGVLTFDAVGLDESLFPKLVNALIFFREGVAFPFVNNGLYLISLSHTLIYCSFMVILLIAWEPLWSYGLKTLKPIYEKTSHKNSGLNTRYFKTQIAILHLILISFFLYIELYLLAGSISTMAINQSYESNSAHFPFVCLAVSSGVIVMLAASQVVSFALRNAENFITLERKQHDL